MTEQKNSNQSTNNITNIHIKGPDWIVPALTRILDLEIRLGNIVADEKWQSADADQLLERITGLGEQDDFDESVIESLFRKVCRALTDEGYSPEEIAVFINTHIKTGSRLKYCNDVEVSEAIG